MQRLLVFLVVGLMVAACGDAEPAAGSATAGRDDAQVAPDFSLVLGDGSTFTLSQEARPVFMVFWAEW